ncbi:c-type cytochrome biogenesis protein CcmI [Devosia submarina]|uniref:c-type cytochrome biogenesis protein CcmI n=1 Tax=Devosia submarina TaxID=1173082 RepID=UPI00130069BD|nr:c-type cytochrome biogenesis protein CcmI [Devosia submarina]
MLFWFVATAVTVIACAALYYAAGPRMVNQSTPLSGDPNSHFRLLLDGIESDRASGKLGEAEAVAAKAELAREILRAKADQDGARTASASLGRKPLAIGLLAVAFLALGLYALLGSPNLPAQPLADRPELAAANLDLGSAVARIEAALAANPDDLQGWSVIAPAYVELGRLEDAIRAYRRVLELGEPTAAVQTSLAEVLLLQANGAGSPEAMDLLEAAAQSDPNHVLSRLYLASELTRQERYPEAVDAWNAAIALSTGEELWLSAAQEGLRVAQSGGTAEAEAQQAQMIAQMVSGLAERLAQSGGSIEEWAQLVRAYLVLGDEEKAQAAYDDAVRAFPQAFDRGDLDTIALGAGLKLNGATP